MKSKQLNESQQQIYSDMMRVISKSVKKHLNIKY